MALKYYLIVLSIVCLTNCDLVSKNDTEEHSNLRKRDVNSYVGLVACAMKQDLPCFIDVAQDFLENRRTDLLAQADAQMLESGRSDPDSKPSHLADTLTKLITEITGMFQNGFSGLFDAGREADEDDSELENDTTEVTTTSDSNGETRELNNKSTSGKKKKKKPLKSLIRLIKVAVVAVIIVLKLSVVLKVLQTAMQFKFMLISLGGFLIQAVKLWMSVRNKKDMMHGHEEIVYKSPYGTDAEYSSPPGAGDYNARSGQDMAYAAQKGFIM